MACLLCSVVLFLVLDLGSPDFSVSPGATDLILWRGESVTEIVGDGGPASREDCDIGYRSQFVVVAGERINLITKIRGSGEYSVEDTMRAHGGRGLLNINCRNLISQLYHQIQYRYRLRLLVR